MNESHIQFCITRAAWVKCVIVQPDPTNVPMKHSLPKILVFFYATAEQSLMGASYL
jgi:hypothetical protein